MSTMKTLKVTTVVLVGALALTGCSSTPKDTPTQAQSATATATQTATAPTSTPTPTLTAGIKVTNTGGTFIEDLKKGLAPGLHLIRLGDTLEYLVVDEHQPLPAEVLDPVVAQVKAVYPAPVIDPTTGHLAPGGDVGSALTAAETAVGDLQVSAGKCVVLYQGNYFAVMADPQSPLGSAGQPLFKEYTKVILANRPKSLDAMIAQFTPFAERAGCTADRLVFIQYTN